MRFEAPPACLTVRAVKSVPEKPEGRRRVSAVVGQDQAGRPYVSTGTIGRELALKAFDEKVPVSCPYKDQMLAFVPLSWLQQLFPRHAARLETWAQVAWDSPKPEEI
jgi:hypothetical protein